MTYRHLTEGDIAEARRLYFKTDTTVAELAKMLGVSIKTFEKRRLAWGWKKRAKLRRLPAKKRRGPPRLLPAKEDPAAPAAMPDDESLEALAARVEAVARREIAVLEERLSGPVTINTERDSRALSSIVKAMTDLKRFRTLHTDKPADKAGPNDEPQPPRDLAELRADLARKLERLRADREAE